jgi:hypothetical protein
MDPIVLIVSLRHALDLLIHHGWACWHLPHGARVGGRILRYACTPFHP